jgi:hypothetical protein
LLSHSASNQNGLNPSRQQCYFCKRCCCVHAPHPEPHRHSQAVRTQALKLMIVEHDTRRVVSVQVVWERGAPSGFSTDLKTDLKFDTPAFFCPLTNTFPTDILRSIRARTRLPQHFGKIIAGAAQRLRTLGVI